MPGQRFLSSPMPDGPAAFIHSGIGATGERRMKKSSKQANGKLAVAYLRRSTKDQAASIIEQRKAVNEYAVKHGYTIVREYVDDGISGDSTEKRFDFLRMLEDAQSLNDFQFVLCWDQDRFGRFDPHEAAYYTFPLSKSGVKLVTCDKGPIDWSDFTEWLTYSVNQHGKHQFLRDLSKNVARGQREAALNGGWLGTAPYGYRIEGERKAKRLELDESKKIKTVQRIFQEYVEGKPLKGIAEGLNKSGISSPSGAKWHFDTIRGMLENRNYTGDTVIGKYSYGKYNSISKDGVKPTTFKGKCEQNEESKLIIHKNHHPAIVDRTTFNKAQKMLAQRPKKVSRRYTEAENPFLLTGLCRCGKCDSLLHGMRAGKDKLILYYECSKHKRDIDACEGTNVRQDELLLRISEYIGKTFLADNELKTALKLADVGKMKAADMPKGFSTLKKLLKPEFPERKINKTKVRTEIAALEAEIKKRKANLGKLDAEFIPSAQDEIRQRQGELEELQAELDASEITVDDLNQATLDLMHTLVIMRMALADFAKPAGSPKLFKSLASSPSLQRFLQAIDSITVETERNGSGNGARHKLKVAKITFNRVGLGTGEVNPHRPD